MPQMASIVINDGQATPVAHTFAPSTSQGEVFMFEDRSGGIAIGYPSISMSYKRPAPGMNGDASNANSRVHRIRVKIAVPTLESTSAATGTGIPPAPTISHVHMQNAEWVMPEKGTLQERKNLVAYAKNLLSDANVLKVLQDQETWW